MIILPNAATAAISAPTKKIFLTPCSFHGMNNSMAQPPGCRRRRVNPAGEQAHTSTGPMLVAVKSGLDQSGIPTTVDGSKNRSPGPTACSANQPAVISTA